MALNVKDIVVKQIKAILGDPILSSVTSDLDGIDNSIELATYEYWKSYPYIHVEDGKYHFNDTSEKLVPIDSIIDAATSSLSSPDKDKAYYIGIFRVDSYNTNEFFFGQGMDSYLLGVPFQNRTVPNNYEKFLLNKTQLGIIQGSIETKVDWINKQIRYIFPYAALDYSVYHAIGFNDPELKFIDYNKIHIFSKMVVDKYLDMIITVRSTLKLQGDYDIDVEHLRSIRDNNKEELKRILERTTKLPFIL